MRSALPALMGIVLASLAAAQDSAPGSRPWEPVRFHPAGDQAPLADPAPIVRASREGAELVVLADGNAEFSFADSDAKEPKRRWVARIPAESVDRLTAAVRAAGERGTTPPFESLLDLARVPTWARDPYWGADYSPHRHQEPDGSWSPADFDWNCRWEERCTGLGKESFRVAATALMLQCCTAAGYPSAGDHHGAWNEAPRRATTWLISRQRADGGFAEPGDPLKHMNDACATIALCRALALASSRGAESRPAQLAARAEKAAQRIAADQLRTGGWRAGDDRARQLSTDVWCLLALRAGVTAQVPVENLDGRIGMGLTAIEQIVAWTEAPPAPHLVGPDLRLHARAARAAARAVAGAKPAFLAEDVAFVLRALRPDQDPPPDAEVLLFTTIAAMKCADSVRDPWLKLVKPYVIDSQVKDGCASGTWLMPSIWQSEGGRLVSTAFMTWILELYYRYPFGDWV